MEGKRVRESAVVLAHIMSPQSANLAGNVHGGVIMKHIDDAASVVAVRHARTNVVTASIDRIDFYSPVFVGNILKLSASVNYVGKTSMEVGVRIETEDLMSGEVRHTASAYLTFVALDEKGVPLALPPLLLESEDEKRRNQEARQRRTMRLEERKNEKENRRQRSG